MAGSRRKKNNGGEEDKGAGMERWLISYADFITLLMVFFVMMYAMSKVDIDKYAAMASSLNIVLKGQSQTLLESPGPSIIEGAAGTARPETPGSPDVQQGELQAVKEQIEAFIKAEELQVSNPGSGQTTTKLSNYINIIEQERGLVISFKDTLLFASGSADLTPQAQAIIVQVGKSLVNIPNYIRVEGHTDNRPIHTAKFPSNWELSVLRASNVVQVLQSEAGISPERLSIIGYGEYRPLVPNENSISQAMNRRVDVVILKKKYDYFEPTTPSTPRPGHE
ncbi:Outer membrane protein, OmpA/MotB, C-terminal [Syntrophomonas zehnderi OL-4]|uniref:Outer membrane protein, OmpA/MotB, C-terminal n=1 Tax=Syntrophomonas zehnderi OL-4 TaxID=690567 RepID=A0A0E4GWU0_9FIRM|nr:flagellar motor protein MotB [Syntrophomonas zehnderi]CQB51998.1 Outer membrane protein, OmpA/MotB, C-terminal [Syntrophomonas zehnderi OL-4]